MYRVPHNQTRHSVSASLKRRWRTPAHAILNLYTFYYYFTISTIFTTFVNSKVGCFSIVSNIPPNFCVFFIEHFSILYTAENRCRKPPNFHVQRRKMHFYRGQQPRTWLPVFHTWKFITYTIPTARDLHWLVKSANWSENWLQLRQTGKLDENEAVEIGKLKIIKLFSWTS